VINYTTSMQMSLR